MHYFYGVTILKIFLNMPLNTFHYHIMFLLKEHTFIVTLSSSTIRNLFFEVYSAVHILLIWKEMKHWETFKCFVDISSGISTINRLLPKKKENHWPCDTHFRIHEKSADYVCTVVKWIV